MDIGLERHERPHDKVQNEHPVDEGSQVGTPVSTIDMHKRGSVRRLAAKQNKHHLDDQADDGGCGQNAYPAVIRRAAQHIVLKIHQTCTDEAYIEHEI
ncbi:hypothetical protein D1872_274280 [compost metagenome]